MENETEKQIEKAVCDEHVATVKDALQGCYAFLGTPPNCRASIHQYVELRCDEGFHARERQSEPPKQDESRKPDSEEICLMRSLFGRAKILPNCPATNWKVSSSGGTEIGIVGNNTVSSCFNAGWIDRYCNLTKEGREIYLANL